MRKSRMALAVASAFPLALCVGVSAFAQTADSAHAPVKELGIVTITGGQPTSLPTQIPTTIEGVTREQIEHAINATDSEDALKYLPSLLVRTRYIGDYNHAILSTRAESTCFRWEKSRHSPPRRELIPAAHACPPARPRAAGG